MDGSQYEGFVNY